MAVAPHVKRPALPPCPDVNLTATLLPKPNPPPTRPSAPAAPSPPPFAPPSAPAAPPHPAAAAASLPPVVPLAVAPAATPPAPAPPPAQAGVASQHAVTALTAQPAPAESAPTPTAETIQPIIFPKESARLPDAAREDLAHLASRMTDDAGLEVQLLAYAAGDEENASKARRLSLSRALAVSSFLIDQGVRSTRIVVRALGNKVPDGIPDRVDISVQKRG